MLSHPTKEARSGRIEILDADAAVIEQMLAYIYTGFAPNVESIAEDLLIAANKVKTGVPLREERILFACRFLASVFFLTGLFTSVFYFCHCLKHHF